MSEARKSAGVEANAILQVLGAGVLVVDADGTISSANAQAARILRGSAGALEGARIDEVVASLDELGTSAAAVGGRGEVSVRHADGTTIELGYTLSAVEDAGGVHHVILFQEITAVLELRRQRDRLLQIAVLGEVMPTLLHEIRNPLAAVSATLEVLAEDATPDVQSDLHAVLSEVRRIALGLQGLDGLARTMHGGQNCAVDLAVRETCRLLERTAHCRGVRVEAIGPDLPLLRLDRGAICGIVFNLVKNAIDACPSGGHVTVDARADAVELVLTIADAGTGMSPDVLARCRDLFFTTKDAGSGIGLALTNQVVEASGGRLTIDSRVGEGTRVVVTVPLAPLPRSRPRARAT